MKLSIISFFLLLAVTSFSQDSRTFNYADFTGAIGSNQGSVSLDYFHLWTGLKGTIKFDASNFSDARFDVTLDASTIDTGIGMRDNHLRKPDYFGVADFPTIRFVSSKIEKSGKPNEAIITGKLTIKKTTKEISFPFRYDEANSVQKFTGEFKINRRDFGVGGSSISLADELIVLLDVSASR